MWWWYSLDVFWRGSVSSLVIVLAVLFVRVEFAWVERALS